MAVRWLYHRSCESRQKSGRFAWNRSVGGGSKRNGARAARLCRRRSCTIPAHSWEMCAKPARREACSGRLVLLLRLPLLLLELAHLPLVVASAKRESHVLSPRAPQFRRKGTASSTRRTHLRPVSGFCRAGKGACAGLLLVLLVPPPKSCPGSENRGARAASTGTESCATPASVAELRADPAVR